MSRRTRVAKRADDDMERILSVAKGLLSKTPGKCAYCVVPEAREELRKLAEHLPEGYNNWVGLRDHMQKTFGITRHQHSVRNHIQNHICRGQ